MMPDLLVTLGVFAKLGLYLTSLPAVGLVCVALLAPAALAVMPWQRWVLGLAIAGIGFALLGFGLTAAALTGTLTGMLDREMLGLMWGTPSGDVLRWRVAGLILIGVGVFVPRLGSAIAVGAALLLIWSFADLGHVSAKLGLLGQVVLVAHLFCASLWIGVLAPLARLSRQDDLGQAAALGHSFGRWALFLLPVLVLAGAWLSWSLTGGFAGLMTSYGLTLLAKVGAVAGLLALGALNKIRFVPGLAAGQVAAASGLRRVIAGEWVVFTCVLFATALLTSATTLPQ